MGTVSGGSGNGLAGKVCRTNPGFIHVFSGSKQAGKGGGKQVAGAAEAARQPGMGLSTEALPILHKKAAGLLPYPSQQHPGKIQPL